MKKSAHLPHKKSLDHSYHRFNCPSPTSSGPPRALKFVGNGRLHIRQEQGGRRFRKRPKRGENTGNMIRKFACNQKRTHACGGGDKISVTRLPTYCENFLFLLNLFRPMHMHSQRKVCSRLFLLPSGLVIHFLF